MDPDATCGKKLVWCTLFQKINSTILRNPKRLAQLFTKSGKSHFPAFISTAMVSHGSVTQFVSLTRIFSLLRVLLTACGSFSHFTSCPNELSHDQHSKLRVCHVPHEELSPRYFEGCTRYCTDLMWKVIQRCGFVEGKIEWKPPERRGDPTVVVGLLMVSSSGSHQSDVVIQQLLFVC